MEIRIPTEPKDLFKHWLLFLNPVLRLREHTELPLLAAFLTLHYTYRHYNEETLYGLLFSPEIKRGIREKLGVSVKSFNKSYKGLINKDMIKDGKLHPNLIKYPRNGEFKLTISFDTSRKQVRSSPDGSGGNGPVPAEQGLHD